MITSFFDFINERRTGEIFNPKRNNFEKIDIKKYPEISEELFDLVKTAYNVIGGHTKIKVPNDIFKTEWDYWGGIDIHKTNDYDIIIFGKKTSFGIKFSGVGHDGENDSKRRYIEELGYKLNTYGYYAEVSDKLCDILTEHYNVPIITDQEVVKKILKRKIEWIGHIEGKKGDGWYSRTINNKRYIKMLIGKPKI